ncbi:MlaD family protein [uncultured Victivallis sp.]|uniref:MlaD family protein n=1 Tax=uncultured Victivallis sp. TaxID=354118 RepID=UPI0025E75D0E|nr:MlaD family protein [uncultured Victivallis sp.]
MNEANRLKLGGFLLISITLLIIGFVSIGITKLFEPRYRAMTVLNTSVEGLAVGSPVKYLGLPVGKITAMTMRQKDGYIAVYFDIFPSTVEQDEDLPPGTVGTNFATVMQQKNLSCFINAAGIMGGAYLELSISDSLPPAVPHLDVPAEDGIIYIPSRPSHIGNAIQNISRMLDELGKVNFIQLADKLNETLDNTSELLEKGQLQNTFDSINRICANLETTSRRLQTALSEENVRKIDRAITNLDESIISLREFGNAPELHQLLTNLNAFLTDASDAIKKAEAGSAALGEEAADLKLRMEMTLTRIDNTLKQLQEFTQSLSNDPNQFVRGRQEKPVLPTERP